MPKITKTIKKSASVKPAATNKYYEAIGRRKTSIARVRLFAKGDNLFLVNGKPLNVYFSTPALREIVQSPLIVMESSDKFGAQVRVKGGGIHSQAEAVRHGLSRALVLFEADFRKKLKKAGFLKRDSRVKERKKFGLKRARKAPQWAKR